MTGPRARIARHKAKKLHNAKKERRPSGKERAAGVREPADADRDHAAEIEAFVARHPRDVQAALRALQRLLAGTAPRATHMMRWSCPSWVLDGDVCYMSAHTRHVNLGFYRGTELADPDDLLEGTGKGMRHVKLPLGKPLPTAALQALIRDALRLDRAG